MVVDGGGLAHQLQDVTVVADAGMISDANKRAIEQAQSFILGAKIGELPYIVEVAPRPAR